MELTEAWALGVEAHRSRKEWNFPISPGPGKIQNMKMTRKFSTVKLHCFVGCALPESQAVPQSLRYIPKAHT